MRMGWIVAAVVAVVLIYVIFVFNRLIRQRNVVREGWSGIDVQLRRRTDLVPNLVETVKGYAAHERGLFEDVTRQRASSIAASDVQGQAAAERALQGSLGAADGGGGSLSRAQGQPEFPQAAGRSSPRSKTRSRCRGATTMVRCATSTSASSRSPMCLVARLLGFREEPFFELDDRSAGGDTADLISGRQAMTVRCIARAALALALIVAALDPASAVERILQFVSDVTVERNGDLAVTETIACRRKGATSAAASCAISPPSTGAATARGWWSASTSSRSRATAIRKISLPSA